jgi:hypothetical protein
MGSTTPHRRQWIASALLLLALAGLVWLWPNRSFWYDETVNAYFSQRGWAEILEWCTQIDNQAALGFVFLKLWAGLVGASEFALRAFSVCCALLSLAGLMALGRRVGGRDAAGWLAAALFALTQSYLYAAYEARPYALMLCLLAWSSVFLWDLWERYGSTDRPLDKGYVRLLVGYLVLALAMAYTHYTGLILAALAQGAYLGLMTLARPSRRRFLIVLHVACGLALGYAPWLVALAGRDIRGGTAMPGRVVPGYALRTYVDFWTHGQRIVTPEARRLGLGMVLLLVASPLAWIVAKRDKGEWRGLLFSALLATLPLMVLLPLVYSFHGKLSGRHGWPGWLGAAMVMALAVSAAERLRWARWPIWAAALALVWLPARTELKPQFDSRLREAFAYIETHAKPEDALILRDGSLFAAVEYYGVSVPWRGLPDVKLIDVRRALYVDEALDALDELIANHGAERFWVLAWQAHIMDPQDLGAGLFELLGRPRKVEGGFGDVAVSLFELRESPSVLRERLAQATPRPVSPVGGAELLDAYIASHETITPGSSMMVHIWWMRGKVPRPNLRVSVRLVDGDGSFFKADGPFYCAVDQPPGSWDLFEERWAPEKPVLSRIWLWVPQEMPVGPASVVMVVYDVGETFEPITVPIIAFEVEGQPVE